MSITGSNNPFACEPVVFANANAIVSLGTITRDGNEFTFSVGFVWKINGVTYQNTAPVVLTIAEASTGFQRIDNALLNTSNTIELQQGLESATIALQPVAPDANIILTSWNISGTAIEDTADPILGTQFIKKTDNSSYSISQSGANVALEIPANGASMLFLTNAALVSVSGFSLVNITGNPAAEVPYNGKPFFIVNNTGVSVTLNHDETADVPFMFVAVADIVMPPSGIIEIRYAADGMSEVFKSWSEVDLSTKLDKVTTSGVERAYIINADGSQGTKATSEFGGNIENDLYRSFFQYSARNDAAGIVALNAPIALVTSGTQSLVNINGLSKYLSIPLQNYLSATPNGSNCGWKQGILADGVIRQGFDIYMIWANNDANVNCQTLVGSYSLTGAIPNLAVSSFTGDFFGVSNDVGDSDLSFYAHRVPISGQTASYTKVATNSNFPAHDTTSAYMLRMEAPCTEVQADRYIKMTLTNIITGATISHTFPYTETPVLNRVVLCVINRNNRNTGVATNIRPSKIHYSRLIY